MTFETNKADWVKAWSKDYTAFRKNAPNMLANMRSIKHITDYHGGENYTFRDFDNNQGDVQVMDLNVRNRMFDWQTLNRGGRIMARKRIVYPVLVDTEQEVFNTMSSPQPDILKTIWNMFNKTRNLALSQAVIKDASVKDEAGLANAVTYTDDGVATLDLTAGSWSEDTFAKIRNNFIAKEMVDPNMEDLGIDVIISQAEGSEIILADRLANTDYYSKADFANGATRRNILGTTVHEVAGNESVNPDINVKKPMLIETGATRSCLALAPEAIAYWESGLEVHILDEQQMRSANYDKSFGIFFGTSFILERTKGDRCMIINTAL